jgi:deoxycytidylate deaminase
MSVDTRREPPQHIIDLAVEVAGWSPCRSKRGVVIHHDGSVIAHGHNYKPRGFECDGSEACKATCRYEAVHAEEAAIVAAGGRSKTDGAEMVHVKAVDGKLVESGPPSCVRCSTLVLASGVSGVWLYQESMWCRYPSTLFHSLSIDANRALLTERDEAIERGRQLEAALAAPAREKPTPPENRLLKEGQRPKR